MTYLLRFINYLKIGLAVRSTQKNISNHILKIQWKLILSPKYTSNISTYRKGGVDVMYQTRETVFHRGLQTPESELKK